MTVNMVDTDVQEESWLALVVDLHAGVLQAVSAMAATLRTATSYGGSLEPGIRRMLSDVFERQHDVVVTLVAEAAGILTDTKYPRVPD